MRRHGPMPLVDAVLDEVALAAYAAAGFAGPSTRAPGGRGGSRPPAARRRPSRPRARAG
jgi:hypothetical protein